jgi:hypothetical protein
MPCHGNPYYIPAPVRQASTIALNILAPDYKHFDRKSHRCGTDSLHIPNTPAALTACAAAKGTWLPTALPQLTYLRAAPRLSTMENLPYSVQRCLSTAGKCSQPAKK